MDEERHPKLGAVIWREMTEAGRQEVRKLAEEECREEGEELTPENIEAMTAWFINVALPNTLLETLPKGATYRIGGLSGPEAILSIPEQQPGRPE